MTTMIVLVKSKEGVGPEDYEHCGQESYTPAVKPSTCGASTLLAWRNCTASSSFTRSWLIRSPTG